MHARPPLNAGLPQILQQDATRRAAGWIPLPWIVVAPLALLACGAAPGSDGTNATEATATSTAPIYAGVEDNDAQQSPGVVAVEVDNGGSTTFELCSGSLVAPNVVLTARHCVSVQPMASVTCDDNGVSANPRTSGPTSPSASSTCSPGRRRRCSGRPRPTRWRSSTRPAPRSATSIWRSSCSTSPSRRGAHARPPRGAAHHGRDDADRRLRRERSERAHRHALPQGRRVGARRGQHRVGLDDAAR